MKNKLKLTIMNDKKINEKVEKSMSCLTFIDDKEIWTSISETFDTETNNFNHILWAKTFWWTKFKTYTFIVITLTNHKPINLFN